jgi:hypothetical protein
VDFPWQAQPLSIPVSSTGAICVSASSAIEECGAFARCRWLTQGCCGRNKNRLRYRDNSVKSHLRAQAQKAAGLRLDRKNLLEKYTARRL